MGVKSACRRSDKDENCARGCSKANERRATDCSMLSLNLKLPIRLILIRQSSDRAPSQNTKQDPDTSTTTALTAISTLAAPRGLNDFLILEKGKSIYLRYLLPSSVLIFFLVSSFSQLWIISKLTRLKAVVQSRRANQLAKRKRAVINCWDWPRERIRYWRYNNK